MMMAFEKLLDSYLKTGTLNAACALLTLSEEIAKRADSNYSVTLVPVSPGSMIDLDDPTISRDSKRVVFFPSDLDRMQVNKFNLRPFVLNAEKQNSVSKSIIGNSPLEICLLLEGSDDSVIVNVTTVSTAIRALLIENVLNQGLETLFLDLMMQEQEQYTYPSGFWPTQNLGIRKIDGRLIRLQTHEIEAGRFLQVIQAIPRLEGFPARAFGSPRCLSPDTSDAITEAIEQFFRFLKQSHDHSRGSNCSSCQ